MRKQYVLLKETETLMAGAVFEEECDNGNQPFKCISMKEHYKGRGWEDTRVQRSRDIVMKQPEWFEEVVPLRVPAKLHAKVQKFIKSLK